MFKLFVINLRNRWREWLRLSNEYAVDTPHQTTVLSQLRQLK